MSRRTLCCIAGSLLIGLVAATDARAQSTDADLELIETATPFVAPGTNITYTLTVKNNGPVDAQGVQVTDQFAAGLASQSVVGSQGSGTVNANNFLMFNVGTIAANGSASVTVVLTVNAATVVGTVISNGATATEFPTTDPDLTNNIASATTTVTFDADLDVTLTATPFVIPGANITYTITVTNHGPVVAQGVQITDQFAAGLSFLNAAVSQGSGTINLGTNYLTLNFGSIAANGSANIVTVWKVDPAFAATMIYDAATATEYPSTDPDLSNNSDIVTTMVTADLIFKDGFEPGGTPTLPTGWQ